MYVCQADPVQFLEKFVKIFCLSYIAALQTDSLMEGTTDNNLNDNRIREKEYEYLLRACANAVRENTSSEGKKVKNGKRALGRKRAYY